MATEDTFDVGQMRSETGRRLRHWLDDLADHPGSHLALLTTSLVLVAPIGLALLLTTQTTAQVYDLNYVRPGGLDVMISNYREVLFEFGFLRLTLNTLFIAGVTTLGGIALSLLAAMAIVFYDFRGKQLAFFFILLTLMVPFIIRVVPLYELVVTLGWHDTWLGVTVPFLATATGVFLYRQHFKSIPVELVETCRLDGVGPLTFLRGVLIPMTKGMTSGLSVILFVSTWNAYLWPLIAINTRDRQMIQVGLRFLQSAQQGTLTQYNLMMTGAVISLIPMLVLLLALRKNLLTTMGLEL
ncbi:carbohydrate ABC transporter permease [Halobaculum sp. EA56]|uniref:carbohydrate ABC transporter permease n=1 Tax=Halobaculum sp. EA56 TaxID=3421648 RepID=UPI003EBC2D26